VIALGNGVVAPGEATHDEPHKTGDEEVAPESPPELELGPHKPDQS
jgi:hypothetical protein